MYEQGVTVELSIRPTAHHGSLRAGLHAVVCARPMARTTQPAGCRATRADGAKTDRHFGSHAAIICRNGARFPPVLSRICCRVNPSGTRKIQNSQLLQGLLRRLFDGLRRLLTCAREAPTLPFPLHQPHQRPDNPIHASCHRVLQIPHIPKRPSHL